MGKKDHYIPQTIQRRFSADGHSVASYNFGKNEIYPVNPINNNLKKNNLYQRIFNGKKDKEIDEIFKPYESKIKDILDELSSINYIKLNPNLSVIDKYYLDKFIAQLASRTVNSFEYYYRRTKSIAAEVGYQISDFDWQMLEIVSQINMYVNGIPRGRLLGKKQFVIDHTQRVQKRLESMNLAIVHNMTNAEFVLLDDPVISKYWFKLENYFPQIANIIKSDRFVLIVLDPKIALLYHQDFSKPDYTVVYIQNEINHIYSINVMLAILSNAKSAHGNIKSLRELQKVRNHLKKDEE